MIKNCSSGKIEGFGGPDLARGCTLPTRAIKQHSNYITSIAAAFKAMDEILATFLGLKKFHQV